MLHNKTELTALVNQSNATMVESDSLYYFNSEG